MYLYVFLLFERPLHTIFDKSPKSIRRMVFPVFYVLGVSIVFELVKVGTMRQKRVEKSPVRISALILTGWLVLIVPIERTVVFLQPISGIPESSHAARSNNGYPTT